MQPDPVILAFDTSAAHCAAALLCGGAIVAARHESMAKGQAERLMPLLEEVLKEGKVHWSDLSAIGVGIGPGNFTGIRISVAAARGLALALEVPAIGISSLEAQVFGEPRPVWSLIDARRVHVYAQRFGLSDTTDPKLVAPSDAKAFDAPTHGPQAQYQPAPAIAHLAAERLASEEPIPSPAPLYIRSADAAPPRESAPTILP